MNINTGELGLRLHELAVDFNSKFNVAVSIVLIITSQ
jgi:hypothetical protein